MSAPGRDSIEVRDVDRELARAVLDRDRKAAAEFVAQYADAVYGYVRRRLHPRTDRVEDVVQEVFLAAFDSMKQYSGTSSLKTWLLGIARHKVDDFYRAMFRTARTVDTDDPEPPAALPDFEGLLDRADLDRQVQATLDRLTPAYGAALVWRYWESRSARDIAEVTGRTEKAVERLLARARAEFKRKWNDGH